MLMTMTTMTTMTIDWFNNDEGIRRLNKKTMWMRMMMGLWQQGVQIKRRQKQNLVLVAASEARHVQKISKHQLPLANKTSWLAHLRDTPHLPWTRSSRPQGILRHSTPTGHQEQWIFWRHAKTICLPDPNSSTIHHYTIVHKYTNTWWHMHTTHDQNTANSI